VVSELRLPKPNNLPYKKESIESECSNEGGLHAYA